MNDNKEEGTSFSNEKLFNVWFHLINLRQPRVTNNRDVAEVNGVDWLDKGSVDGKKVDRLGICMESLVAEDPSRANIEEKGKVDT